MLENYPHERLMEYITNSKKLWDDAEMILNEIKSKWQALL